MSNSKRILIVDDEALARQRIARYLRQFGQEFLIETADSGLDAVGKIQSFHPHILFLDVEMPGLNGFELLQQFEQRPFQIIFQTAYDQFAIRAFEENACDYLLKPFTAARLHQALARVLDRVADEERLRALETQLITRDGYLRRFTVKQGARLRLIEEHDVFCFISQDHYTCVYFGDAAEGICDLSLTRLVERLDPQIFRQLHRNNIVRIAALSSFVRSREGELTAELANGLKLPVSRSHRRLVKDLVNRT